MRHDRRCFGRLEQEDQRFEEALRPLDGHRTVAGARIVHIDKLTKPFVPINLVGPQVSLPARWVPASRGSIHFFVRNKEALPVGPS